MLVNLATLTPTMQGALRRLVAEITEHDGISPINESASLGIDGLRDADFFFMGRRSDPHGFVVCDPSSAYGRLYHPIPDYDLDWTLFQQ